MSNEAVKLYRIASHCSEYTPVSDAQGYGISWLNSSVDDDDSRCDLCIYWREGKCSIYKSRTKFH
ncbi:MAG: DUF4242 domain-containing protein [Firmicutes bacterium]|nr:DUF4242 domain-containing protein [Bacillota bacterium]